MVVYRDEEILSKLPVKKLWEKQAAIHKQQSHNYELYTHALKAHNHEKAKELEEMSKQLEAEDKAITHILRSR
jgi:hypothetical protein